MHGWNPEFTLWKLSECPVTQGCLSSSARGLVVLAEGEEAKKVSEGDCQAEEYDVFVLGTMQVAAISDPREVCSVLTTARSKPGSHRT